MPDLEDRFVGSVLCLALGDALGAPFEGGPLERGLWALMGRTRDGKCRWTDDTQMSLDLADSLVECGALVPDDLAARFARSYAWTRGYGPGAAQVLKAIRRGASWQDASRSVYPEGSFGNGGAMRAPIVGLFFGHDAEELRIGVDAATRITHAHPLAIEGARLIARAVSDALASPKVLEIWDSAGSVCAQQPFQERLRLGRPWLATSEAPTPSEVARRLGNGIAATESCVTALYAALRFLHVPLPDLLAFVAKCRGDVDTIGAMAGAIWGAANGSGRIPPDLLRRLEQRHRIEQVGAALFQASAIRRIA